MRLISDPKFPPREFAQLKTAMAAVEAAEQGLDEAGREIHLAVKRLPSERPAFDVAKLSAATDLQRPGDLAVRRRDWLAMRAQRERAVHFAFLSIRHWEDELRKATIVLEEAVEQFRVAVHALYLVPDNERSASLASITLRVCDDLVSRIIEQDGYRDWPKSLGNWSVPEHHQIKAMFDASRRGFTYREKIGGDNWKYFQHRRPVWWLATEVPQSPCLTEDEAERMAMSSSFHASRGAGRNGGYLVQTYDLDKKKPGKLCLGRNTELLGLADGDIPAGVRMEEIYPWQPEWDNVPAHRGTRIIL